MLVFHDVGYKWRPLSYLAPLFSFHLELHNIDQFPVDMVKAKLRYWSLTLVGCTLIANQVYIYVVPLVLHCIVGWLKKNLVEG